jgi:hypothetical protein
MENYMYDFTLLKAAALTKLKPTDSVKHNARSVVSFAKDNWAEIGALVLMAYIAEDVDQAATMAEGSFAVDLMTARSEGVV